MIFSDPDDRRALRSAVNAAMALIGLALVGWLIHLLRSEPGFLFYIAMALLAINIIREIFHGAENTVRAIDFSIGKDGVKASIGGPTKAAQDVADAAQDEADAIASGPRMGTE